jgi:DNA (cytosine-5)-methyltransferase 1
MGAAAVVGDLASLDYDTRAGTVRASSIGAPHQRKRWFCVATDTDSVTTGGDTGTLFREKESRRGEPNQGNRSPHGDSTTGGNDAVTDAERGFEQGESGSAPRLAWQSGRSAREAVTDANGEGLEGFGGQHKLREASEEEPFSWGRYDRAVRRWERVLGRPAPVPVVDNRVSAVFVEWMMGLEEGHVTDIAASRAKALACLGNGVVPQQAKRALELLT